MQYIDETYYIHCVCAGYIHETYYIHCCIGAGYIHEIHYIHCCIGAGYIHETYYMHCCMATWVPATFMKLTTFIVIHCRMDAGSQ